MTDITHLGIFENLLATVIFFIPNFLFYFVSAKLGVYLFYNFCVMFLLFTVISHLKWGKSDKTNEYKKV